MQTFIRFEFLSESGVILPHVLFSMGRWQRYGRNGCMDMIESETMEKAKMVNGDGARLFHITHLANHFGTRLLPENVVDVK